MTSTRHLSPPAFHAITTKLFIKRMCRKQYSQNKERIPCLQINHIITKPVFWNYHLRDPWTWSWLFITYSGMADRFYIPLDIFSTRRKIQTKPAKVERTRIDSCHKKKKSRARLAISQAHDSTIQCTRHSWSQKWLPGIVPTFKPVEKEYHLGPSCSFFFF